MIAKATRPIPRNPPGGEGVRHDGHPDPDQLSIPDASPAAERGHRLQFTQDFHSVVRVLGKGHPRTLTTQGNLAQWRGEAGDAAGAADILAQLLADMVRVLGEEHHHTLTTRNNLARWRGEAGDAGADKSTDS